MSAAFSPRWRRLARRARRLLGWSVLLAVLLAALTVAVASRLLPLLDHHPERVADWLARQIEAPVSIGAVAASWNRAGPELLLSDLRIGRVPEVLDMSRARLQVNIYAGLWPGIPLTELLLERPELELSRDATGRWRLDGFGRSTGGRSDASQFQQLDRFGAIEVTAARLRFHEEVSGLRFELPNIDARLQHARGRLRIGIAQHGDAGAALRLAAEMDAGMGHGRVFVEGVGQDWAGWMDGLSWRGLELAQARGDARAWIDLGETGISEVQLETRLASVRLRAGDADAGGPSRQVKLGGLDGRARLTRSGADSWRLQVPRWRIDGFDPGAAANPRPAEVARQVRAEWNGQGAVQLQAEQLELGPVLELATLWPDLPTTLRPWLAALQPQLHLQDFWLHWVDPDAFEVRAERLEAGWQSHHGVPAMAGLAGRLDGDAGAVRLQLEPGRWQVRAEGVLREPFQPQVSGEILLLREAGHWRVDAPELQLREDDYTIALAGGASFPETGGALLDLRADVGNSPLVVAKRFWPVNVMPEPVVEWLDAALIDGRVAHGSAVVRGNVLDWPFDDGEGHFEAEARLADARLQFHSDWPQAEGINGVARFINAGMEVDLTGAVVGTQVNHATGGIPDFGDAILTLDARGQGPGPALLRLLRESPLQQDYGEFLDGLSVGGHGDVALRLRVPLEDHLGEPGVEGHVDVERMDLEDRDWGLAFDAASGRVRFSDRGFSADELNVGFAGSLAALSIAVGDYTSDEGHLAEASLRGRFDAAALIASSEHSRWLDNWFEGESDWNLQLTVPSNEVGPAARSKLRLRSDLVGTAITLPAPLRKAAAEGMALDLSLDVPLQESTLDLRLGRLLRVQGRLGDTEGFSGLASFGEESDEPIPARGLAVVGQIPALDVAAWGSAFGDTRGAGELELNSASLHVGELNLLGRRFRETGIRVARDAQQLEIGLSGADLDGSVLIPFEGLAQRGITARFQRLHWPADDEDPAGAEASDETPVGPPPPSLFAPNAIPPLHLESADTRFGDASLGTVWLETRPTREGLHVERLDTHSDGLDLKAKGDWTLSGLDERSRLSLDYSTHNAGDLLEALGFARLIDGGATHGQLELAWEGGPGDFDWGRADGRLEVNIGQGRVLEVEPGAGRLFGLLSLTEIPRRLMLDFSDFFKSGFAFNQMAGSFDIQRGNAVTEGFRIDAPSARILLNGRTGLKARDYDQTMEIVPKAGSVLPAIGAIAGGPAGAAVGAVAQAVLNQPLKEMTRTTYRITGPWSDPRIETIERGGG